LSKILRKLERLRQIGARFLVNGQLARAGRRIRVGWLTLREDDHPMAHRFNTNTAVAEKEWDDLSFVLVDDIKPSPGSSWRASAC
jgi:hypothetical protein